MKFLIDTNVVLDVFEKREPFYANSRNILELAARGKIEAYITSNCVSDIYYTYHKHNHNSDECKKAIATLLKILNVLDVNGSDCTKALVSNVSDYEDAMLIETGLRNNIDYIVTRDYKHFRNSKIPALDPSELS